MPDELGDIFRRSAAEPLIVPDAAELWRRGRARRVTRAGTTAVAAMVAVIGTALTIANFGSPPVDRVDRIEESFIRPAGTDRDDARTATFVLHAFLAHGGYRYDYKGVTQEGTKWTVEFNGGPIVEVVSRGSNLEVESVTGPRSEEAASIVGYVEPASRIPNHGAEFFGFRATRTNNGEYNVDFRSFWAGPIPSGELADCRLEVRDRKGRLLYSEPSRGAYLESPPPVEGARDGGATAMGFVLDRPRPPEQLVFDFPCTRVRPGHFVAVGDTPIHAVDDAPPLIGSGGGAKLDPARHVVVSSKIDWRGLAAPGLETICIGHVFGYDGKEINAHGTTLYASGETEAQIERRSEGDRVAIAVDVGDPDLANYATIECRPTVPGVLFGPDQEG